MKQDTPSIAAIVEGLSEADKADVRNSTECVAVVVQPALEPWPRILLKVGNFAGFLYVNWLSWSFGFDVLSGGLALQIGPTMVGAVRVDRFLGLAVRTALQGQSK